MIDRYDATTGRLLSEPDDGPEWCARHDQDADTCGTCRAEFEQEEQEYRAFRAANPLIGDRPENAEAFKDLPW